MNVNPLESIQEKDPELVSAVQKARDLAFSDGALSRKNKLLMAMAIDASHGAVNGVESLARQALNAGAAREEILEAIRVAYYISGASGFFTAASGLKDIL